MKTIGKATGKTIGKPWEQQLDEPEGNERQSRGGLQENRRETVGNTTGNPEENHRKTIGKTIGKPQEATGKPIRNRRKTGGKP